MPEWLVLSISILVLAIFAVGGLVAVLSTVIGLPGAWLTILGAVVIEFADPLWLPDGDPVSFGWGVVIAALLIAAVGELLEFLAGALGAARGGATRRGAIGATVGGLIGGIFFFWVPPPIIGALVMAVLGTFLGAMAGELTRPDTQVAVSDTVRPATGAAIGRVLGTLAKVPCAAAVWIAFLVAGTLRLVG